MKEIPMLFCAEMVRAILEGRKTETRRLLKPQPILNYRPELYRTEIDGWGRIRWRYDDPTQRNAIAFVRGPDLPAYIQARAPATPFRFWVKEQHFIFGRWYRNGLTKTGRQKWKFVHDPLKQVSFEPPLSKPKRQEKGWHWRNSLFMPRWASRISLICEEVLVERLQEITDKGATAEGVAIGPCVLWKGATPGTRTTVRLEYAKLWDSINGKGSWESNPFVIVYQFRRET
jgi:hypothetical protein